MLDAKLASKADAEPLKVRPLIDAAKAQGATIVKAIEDKGFVVANLDKLVNWSFAEKNLT